MKKTFGALSLQCLVATIFAPSATAMAQPAHVSCATPDQWTGAARTSIVRPAVHNDTGHAAQPSIQYEDPTLEWNASYRGKGLGRTRGATRARIAKQGGLWIADADHVGVDDKAALAAFRKIGVWARLDGNGRILFRAVNGDKIATRALAMVSESQVGRITNLPKPSFGVEAPSVAVDTAFMRLEGRYSKNAVQFIESLPSGMDIYPFGTSYVVKIPASLVPAMWDVIDGEGTRVFLVGSSARASQGKQVSDATQFCGAAALMRRFPTPTVSATLSSGAIIEIESQRASVSNGDVILTVQNPPYGRGIEVGVSRFMRR